MSSPFLQKLIKGAEAMHEKEKLSLKEKNEQKVTPVIPMLIAKSPPPFTRRLVKKVADDKFEKTV
ncbi:hypothetical protein RDI58_017535 [Solanum bulbocastanum]|uniref:Uncharacterized protein n=1 Tax=Solanum bulbocastanum TaxID=147425 RepID=A0AAN8TEU5_SOLBU